MCYSHRHFLLSILGLSFFFFFTPLKCVGLEIHSSIIFCTLNQNKIGNKPREVSERQLLSVLQGSQFRIIGKGQLAQASGLSAAYYWREAVGRQSGVEVVIWFPLRYADPQGRPTKPGDPAAMASSWTLTPGIRGFGARRRFLVLGFSFLLFHDLLCFPV